MYQIPPIMTRKEAQEILRVSKGTILKLIQSGELESFKIGKQYRLTRLSVLEYIKYNS